MADDLEPKPGMRLDAVGEVLGQLPGPGHEHVAWIVAAGRGRLERRTQERRPRSVTAGWATKSSEEEPADVVLLEEEEGREGDRDDEEGRSGDVRGPRSRPASGRQPVEAGDPQHRDPEDGEDDRRGAGRRRARATARDGVAVAEAEDGDGRGTRRTAIRPSATIEPTRSAMRCRRIIVCASPPCRATSARMTTASLYRQVRRPCRRGSSRRRPRRGQR